MNISSHESDEVLVIKISGDLMGGTDDFDAFKDEIFEAIENDRVNVVVDLEEVRWMNSSGLSMLITGLTTVRGSGGDLKLAHVSDKVRRPLEITKLDTVFSIYNSVDEAVNSF